MFRLYAAKESGSQVVQALLEAGEFDYEIEWLSLADGENLTTDYLAINPAGVVPSLKLPDGRIMIESAAISIFLADLASADKGIKLIPDILSMDRSRCLQWIGFMSASIYPAYLRHYHPEWYVSNQQAQKDLSDTALVELLRNWKILDEGLIGSEFSGGNQISLSDFYLQMLWSWYPAPDDLVKDCPNCNRVRIVAEQHASNQKAILDHVGQTA
jgi:glutathione S-transferase